jgi:hypothetical protein
MKLKEFEMTDKLSQLESRIISYCEMSWFSDGRLPTPEAIRVKFNLTTRELNGILSKEIVAKSFDARGIPTVAAGELTPQQVTAIQTMTDPLDGRSYKKRLSDMGITTKIWDGWKQNDVFKRYYLERAERILGGSLPEAHAALVDRVQSGDISALRFYYEITGRYTGKDTEVDIRAIINRIFEIIATHVQDPATLMAIAHDLKLLTALDSKTTIGSEAKPPVRELEGNI